MCGGCEMTYRVRFVAMSVGVLAHVSCHEQPARDDDDELTSYRVAAGEPLDRGRAASTKHRADSPPSMSSFAARRRRHGAIRL